MGQNESIASANAKLARQINQEARRDPASPYAGKLVGIVNGQVVVVAETWREVVEHLRQVEPDSKKCFCVEAAPIMSASRKSGGRFDGRCTVAFAERSSDDSDYAVSVARG